MLKISKQLELPLDVVTEAVGIVATRGAGKSFTSAVVLEEAHAAHVPFVVIDPNGVYWGLRSNAKGDGPGLPIYILGGPRGDLPLEPTAGKLVANLVVDSGHSFVLDLSDLPTKTAARTFVADFLDHLHRRKSRDRTTLLLVVDEADEFAPQNPRGETARSLGAMETIAKRGRAFGLGIVVITQRTQALNKDVLDLIDTLVVMRQLSERSRAAVKGWIADKDVRDESGVIESLQSLPTGTAWVWSPVREILAKIPVRPIRTFDSYATPKPGEVRVEPSARAHLDLDALGEQMRATVEKAKDSDPAELRRRIRELERTKAVAERVVEKVVEVERVVEVHLLTDDDRQFLERATSAAAELVGELGLLTIRLEAISAAKLPSAAARPDRPAVPRPERPARPVPAAPRVTAESNGSAPAGDVSRPQQKILDALAWFEAIGVTEPRRPPLAAVAGVSSKSSGFRANLSTLSGKGLVLYASGGRVYLSDGGRAIAQPPEISPTIGDLHDAIYNMVSRPQAAILQQLVHAYPNPLERDQLAELAGMSPASSGFRANVSTLSGFELVTYPTPGTVAAAPLLFPGEGE